MSIITIRPSAIYALLMVIPLFVVSLAFLGLAWWLLHTFILISLLCSSIALYRYWQI
ncbi:hypothetical protein [Mucilaginibacter paludis]|uniref:hypothetical protein n=1 Tax=Mucilaginibacter paludis TaxID=423351 RepID=UPI0002DE45C6|nr:hypothetical protein [Mucilaginibacter paludis]